MPGARSAEALAPPPPGRRRAGITCCSPRLPEGTTTRAARSSTPKRTCRMGRWSTSTSSRPTRKQKTSGAVADGDSRDANEIALTFDVAITDGDAATLNRLADGSIHPFEGWTSTGLTEPNVWVDQVRGGSGPASGHLPIDPSTRRLEGAARVAGRRPLGATATNQLQGFSSRSRIGAEHAPHCG